MIFTTFFSLFFFHNIGPDIEKSYGLFQQKNKHYESHLFFQNKGSKAL